MTAPLGSEAPVLKTPSDHEGMRAFEWVWQGTIFRPGREIFGDERSEPLLMLPALSTVSTRDELRALAKALMGRRAVTVDWPGFGDTPRPCLDYGPALYRGFLQDLVALVRAELGSGAFPAVACGHGAGYAIDLEARAPGTFTHLVLIAPTWRGPLPTIMNGQKPIQRSIRKLIHAPVVGEALYRLNVSRPVVRMMYRGHVFADPGFLTEGLLTERMRLTRRPGARFASACFVTGALDPFADRGTFLECARRVRIPLLVLYGSDTPRRSRAEMDALAALPGIASQILQRGALGMAEERAADLAPMVEDFLSSTDPSSAPS